VSLDDCIIVLIFSPSKKTCFGMIYTNYSLINHMFIFLTFVMMFFDTCNEVCFVLFIMLTILTFN